MNELVVLLYQLSGVLLVATLLSSIFCSMCYAPFRRFIAQFNPHTRAAARLGYALIAPAVGLIASLTNSLPGAAQWFVFEHCHGSQCASHAPLLGVGSVGHISLVAGTALLLFGLAVGVCKVLLTSRGQLLTLFNLGNQQKDYVVIQSDQPLAWCCGLLRPQIILSSALLEQFNNNQVNVILAHERAHAARLDNLRNVAARWSTGLWLPHLRKQITSDLSADNEACCDAIAARGAPALFQQVVEMMAQQPQPSAAGRQLSFGSDQAEARVAATQANGNTPSLVAHLLVAHVWAFQAVLVSSAAHAVVEALTAVGV